MSTFEEVCLLSCEQWVDSFPDDIPNHRFSEQHNRIMDNLFNNMQIKVKPKMSKNTIRFLLIAAILLALATTVVAVPLTREYIVNKFSNYSEYEVLDRSTYYEVDSPPILNYVPTGFVLTDNEYIEHVEYADGDMKFTVTKHSLKGQIGFDTEEYPSEEIMINGIKGVYFRSDEDYAGIVFNDNKYIYSVDGNIDKEELVKIAQNIE